MSDKNKSAGYITTPPVRLCFLSVFEPSTVLDGTDSKYRVTLLLPPDADLKPYYAALGHAMKEKWGEKPANFRKDLNPIKDCEDKSNISGFLPGWHFIRATSQSAPALVDQRLNKIVDKSLLYPGCWAHVNINAYGFDRKTGAGVTFGLNAIQFVRHDERLDGRVNVADVFEPIAFDDSDAPSGATEENETVAADGLFG